MQSGYLRLLVYCSHVIRRHNQLAISQVANKQLRANCEIDLQPTPIYSTTYWNCHCVVSHMLLILQLAYVTWMTIASSTI